MELPFNNTTVCTVPTYHFFVCSFIFIFLKLIFKLNSLINRPTIPPSFYVRASPLPSLSVFQADAPIPGMAYPWIFTESGIGTPRTKYIKPALVKSAIHSYRGATLQDLYQTVLQYRPKRLNIVTIIAGFSDNRLHPRKIELKRKNLINLITNKFQPKTLILPKTIQSSKKTMLIANFTLITMCCKTWLINMFIHTHSLFRPILT